MSGTLVHSACIEAAKKNSHKLVSLLSGGTVGLTEFGQALFAAEFMEQSGLSDALDSSLKLTEKANKMCQIVTTQVQQVPEKYYKAYLTILEKYPPLSSVLESIRTDYKSKSNLRPEANTSTELGESHSPVTEDAKTSEASLAVDKTTLKRPLLKKSAFPSGTNITTELGSLTKLGKTSLSTTPDTTPRTPHASTELGASHLQTEQAQTGEASSSATADTTKAKPPPLSTKKKFACPCGKCSLRQFLDGNCPEKGSEFPCLNINLLSEGEQHLLKQKLIDESEKIKISFAKLEMSTKRFLKSEASCSPEELKDNILKMSILKDASDFDSIFHILINSNVWSWYSFGYLKRIICICSNDDSELFRQLNEYNNEFEEFCQRSVFECPHLISNFRPEYHDCLFVKLADEDDDFSLKNLKNKFETKLSTIIKVEPLNLVLLTYQDGCTQLIYSLPRAVAKKAFPLSLEQKEMLMKMGVLECYLFSHEAHVERERADIKILNSDLEMQLQTWKKHAQEWPLRLLVCGLGGVGKSALVNHLLQLGDEKWAEERWRVGATTSVVSKYERITERGIKVCIFAHRHLFFVRDEKIIAMMLKETDSQTEGNLDLVLFCLSLGNPAAQMQRADADAIRVITRAFTREIWKKAIIVLTCANLLAEYEQIKKAEDYKAVVDNIKTRLRDVLRINKVSEEVISQLPIVTAGHTNPILKYEEDTSSQAWDDRLFLEALKQVEPSQCPSLLRCRLGWKDVITAALVGGAGGLVETVGVGIGVGAVVGAAGGPAGSAVGAGIEGAISGGLTDAVVGGTAGASGGVLLSKRREIITILKIKYNKWQMEIMKKKESTNQKEPPKKN